MNAVSAPTRKFDPADRGDVVSRAGIERSRRRSFSVRLLLIMFVMFVVVPAWGFAAYVAAQFAMIERQMIENEGRSMSKTLASNVNFRLQNLEATVSALSLSNNLQAEDFQDFYIEAKALANVQGVALALVAPDGRQIFNTNAPFGNILPSATKEIKYSEAISTRTTQYSSLFWGDVSNAWLMSVTVPVVVENEARFALVVGTTSSIQWGSLLENVELQQGWAVALIDDKNIISARRPSPELYVGKPTHPSVPPLLGSAQSGWGIGMSIDHRPVHIFYQRLNKAPWTVLVGVPSTQIDSGVWNAVSPVIFGGLFILLITILAAWLIGRQFTTELVDIVKAATAFRSGQNELATAAPSRVKELAELRATLESSMAQRLQYESRLKGLINDKELLMQEVHHRVKNSLQLVRGILSLQARTAQHPEAKSALNDAATRILTVADVHQHLYQGLSTAEVNVQQYLADLASDLTKSLLDHSPDRQVKVTAPRLVWASERIIALGIITTELVTNAIKYGDGIVSISLTVEPDQSAELVVEDEGQGFSADFKMGTGGGLGSKLIASLVRPEEGSVRIDRSSPHGRVIVSLFANWRRATPD